MSLLEEEAESKSETSDESVEQDDAGVKNYHEKPRTLIYTSTDGIQQIIMLDSFHRMGKKYLNFSWLYEF